jgi:hypothetical protein
MIGLATLKLKRDNLTKGLVVIFLLFGISAVTLAQPQEVSALNVQHCRFVDIIEGSSGYGKKSEWQSFAKYSALTQAEKLGASHVVWERFTSIGAFNGVATGKAYNCNS